MSDCSVSSNNSYHNKYGPDDIFTFGSQPGTPLSQRFSDIDMLECGGSKETFIEEHLTPVDPQMRKLRKCHVVREDKANFYLYCETTGRFMLSAKMVDDTIYISQYEEFCHSFVSELELLENPGQLGSGDTFCAALRLNPQTRVYTLYNRTCEGCDELLGLHTCGAQSRVNGDRQILLETKHGSTPVQAGADSWIECNTVNVKIPVVYADLSRDVWCPRYPKNRSANAKSIVPQRPNTAASQYLGSSQPQQHDHDNQSSHDCDDGCSTAPQVMTPGRSRSRLDKTHSSTSMDLRHEFDEETKDAVGMRSGQGYSYVAKKQVAGSNRLTRTTSTPVTRSDKEAAAVGPLAGNEDGECIINTRVPRYDRNTGSLRMKFLNNRVRVASSKNLIFCLNHNSDNLAPSDSATSAAYSSSSGHDSSRTHTEERVVMQFGKYNDERFNLDFRFPLAPVQAFGIALSLFNWQAANDRKA